MAITSKRLQDIEKLKDELHQHWKISDLGELTWYLGFCVCRDRNVRTIAINQQSYIKGMLENFTLTSAKPVLTPMDPGTKFLNEQCPSTPTQLAKMHGIPYAHPEPLMSTLGGCKKGHGISGNHVRIMAHLRRQTNH